MRQVGIIVAAAVLAATVGACADPYYGYRTRTYAYTSDYYYPNYYSSRPVYYSSAPVYYSSGRYPYYGSTGDYYRNYNGIHSSAEVSGM
jgi:hypothetical protein